MACETHLRATRHSSLVTRHSSLVTRHYQLAFRTPGIIPDSASSRKQIRHTPKRRRKARERPQRLQRLCACTLNFGLRFDFSIQDFFAIARYLKKCVRSAPRQRRRPPFLSSPRNGIPNSFNSASAKSSRSALVTKVMSMPCICSMSS